MATNY